MNSKYTEIKQNHPKECSDDPCHLRQVIIISIWLDFYVSPWVLSSIHFQRSVIFLFCCNCLDALNTFSWNGDGIEMEHNGWRQVQ